MRQQNRTPRTIPSFFVLINHPAPTPPYHLPPISKSTYIALKRDHRFHKVMNAARAGHFTRRDRSRAGPSGLRVPQTKRTKPASGTIGTSGRRASRVGSGGRCIIGTELRRCIDAESVTNSAFAAIPLLHHALCLARSGRRATTTERTSPHPVRAVRKGTTYLVLASWITCDIGSMTCQSSSKSGYIFSAGRSCSMEGHGDAAISGPLFETSAQSARSLDDSLSHGITSQP